MIGEWAAAYVFLALVAAITFGMIAVAKLLRVTARVELPTKRATYECGEEPEGGAWIRFHPRYYLVALVFVLFDVEVIFLFPWALTLGELGARAGISMLIFVGILLLGWLYALKKGALKWA